MRSLGIDMGGTATRWVLRDAQGEVSRGQVTGANGAIENPARRAAFVAALQAIPHQGADSAVLGVTGSGLTPDPELAALSRKALGIENIRVLNDVHLAWHAAFGKGPGHLVLAGTGSVGLSVAADGALTAVGGRGTLVDDGGSGAWIALRAIDALCRDWDEHGERPGPLADALAGIVGAGGWDALRVFLYGTDRGGVAALAPAVAQAARAGCPLSLAVLTQAGLELARLAQVLVARRGPAPVKVTGGALALHPVILDSLRAATPDLGIEQVTLDAAASAAQLARQGTP